MSIDLALTVSPIVVAASMLSAAVMDAWRDRRYFDRRFGVDTSRERWIGDVIARNADDGYTPVPVRSIRSLTAALPIDYADYTFVDLGSGKGRALLVAAEFGFRRIVGVERSPRLTAIARRNLARVANPAQKCFEIDLLCMDAGDYEPPEGPLVVFVFNAFERAVMQRVVGNLTRSFEAAPRPIYLLYFHPRLSGVVAESACFRPFRPAGALTDYFEMFAADPARRTAAPEAA